MPTNLQGRLIVFEGLDGSGTTTQAKLLTRYLTQRGRPTVFVREPGGTKLGSKVRRLLLEDEEVKISALSELLLYETSRAQLITEKLKPLLSEGKTVVSDRFALSSVAYQGYGRGISIKEVKRLNQLVLNGVAPDITFFLDVDLHERQKRLRGCKPDRIEREELEFYRKVRKGYQKEVAADEDALQLDGSLSKEEISSKVAAKVEELL